eukprot:TRINITY_DN2587_c0_g1_i3.p1 TRINITY_DN2587_c0_g1~~TRINITY_DN2587_c0_g1_i3.p1  ORF type:complete len:182 (-),score=56.25 TRINITY_DN2587_c0_g1_i3:262-807(-)
MATMDIAPLRSMDEFLLKESRFQVPDFNNVDKFFNRLVSNLLYYQTNYFISALVIFLLIGILNPGKMLVGILTMCAIFGLLYYMSNKQTQVKTVKKEHPTLVMLATFCAGYFFIYQSGCILVFLMGVMLPIVFVIVHASLRLRNLKNKIASVAGVTGVAKKTPMALILDEWGIEPDMKYIS